jgi:hypothetical protein
MNKEAIRARILKEQKSGLGYIINALDHNHFAAIYWDTCKKKELQEIVMNLEHKWSRLQSFQTYKDLF